MNRLNGGTTICGHMKVSNNLARRSGRKDRCGVVWRRTRPVHCVEVERERMVGRIRGLGGEEGFCTRGWGDSDSRTNIPRTFHAKVTAAAVGRGGATRTEG
ncbi:hypothetical protein A0H81_06003 [Grifola frondosa]|uniref:Uncharacterized protein n=1 Tax=Grifola frondosa TaxID=5627 RepID=A0A1C7MBD6_GRIFR|nr:hypothetical protein A0H81_06003 [Grifola frondosa]